eukprot:3639735-Alexandrium_andersonii.AAC.1
MDFPFRGNRGRIPEKRSDQGPPPLELAVFTHISQYYTLNLPPFLPVLPPVFPPSGSPHEL